MKRYLQSRQKTKKTNSPASVKSATSLVRFFSTSFVRERLRDRVVGGRSMRKRRRCEEEERERESSLSPPLSFSSSFSFLSFVHSSRTLFHHSSLQSFLRAFALFFFFSFSPVVFLINSRSLPIQFFSLFALFLLSLKSHLFIY